MDIELERAARRGDVEFLREKVAAKKPDDYFLAQSSAWGGGTTIFNLALWGNRVDFVKEGLKILQPQIIQKLISQQDNDGWNPLHVAVRKEDIEMVRLLLEFYKSYKGQPLVPENLNHPRNKPWLAITSWIFDSLTPFHLALRQSYEDIALEILSMDMELLCNKLDSSRSSPLFVAVYRGLNRVAEIILNSSCTYSLSGEHRSNAIHIAPNSSDSVLRLLLEKHSNHIEEVDDYGFTVLHQWAKLGKDWPFNIVLEGNFPTVRETMFKNLIYKTTENTSGDSPLHTATKYANRNDIAIVQALVEGYKKEITTENATTTITFDDPPWKITNNQGKMPLHLALDIKQEKVANYLLSIDSTLCNIHDAHNNSPLFLAVKNGANQVAEKILASSNEYSTSGEHGSTALHFIPATDSSGKVMRLLLEKHPDLVKCHDDNGWNVLHQWAAMGEVWPLEFLIYDNFHDAKSEVFTDLIYKINNEGKDNEGKDNPLHIVARSGNVKFARALVGGYQELQSGVGIEPHGLPWKLENNKGETPFAIALTSQIDIALIFLSAEIVLPKTDVVAELDHFLEHIMKTSNLQWLRSCPENVLKRLLEKHEQFLDVSDDQNFKVLHQWASMGHFSPLRWLQGNKFPKERRTKVFTELIYVSDNKGDNPLHIAAKSGHTEVVKELVNGYRKEKQRTLDQTEPWIVKNNNGDTPLHLALKSDSIDVVLFLLEYFDPPSLHICNNQTESVLFLAIRKPSEQVVQLRISNKPKVCLSSKESNNEHVAMITWLRSCSGDVLREVLRNNTEFLDAFDNKGCNVLHKWAEDGNVSALDMISKDDSSTAKNKVYKDLIVKKDEELGNSPLHIAVTKNKIEFVKRLVNGYKQIMTDMDLLLPWQRQNKHGNTPLHIAIYLKHTDLALYLFKLNSSVWKIRNNDGESPFYLAVDKGLDNVVEELLKSDITFSMLRKNSDTTVLHLLPRVSVSTAKKLVNHFWWIINLRDKQGRTALDAVEEKSGFDDIKDWLKNPLTIPNKKLFDCYKLCEKDELLTVLSFNDQDFLHYIELKNYQDYLSLLKNSSLGELKNCVLETDGTTPLHRALVREDIGFAKALLIDDKVQRNIKEKKDNKTATDLLADLCNKHDNWASMCKIINVNPHLRTQYIQPGTDMEQMRNTLSVVAALLATITFAAGFTLPGGLHGDSGDAVLARKGSFIVFLLADAYAMCTSMLVLFCLIWSMVSNHDMSLLLVDRSVVILMHSLYATMLAFMTGIYATVAHSSFWATIIIFIMCLGSAGFAWQTVNFFKIFFSKELKGVKILKPPEQSASTSTDIGSGNASERSNNIVQDKKDSACSPKEDSASTSTNIDSRNASERSNNIVQNCCSLFFKYQSLTLRENQDKKDSACSPKEESAPILSNVGSKKESERCNKLVQILFGILNVKKFFSKGNQDARDSTRSLEQGEASTSKNDVSHVTDVK